MKIPLYWDLDIPTSETDEDKHLQLFQKTLYDFIKEKIPYIFNLTTYEDYLSNFYITKNVRIKYFDGGQIPKLSYHVIYRDKKNGIYSKGTQPQKLFNDYFIKWILEQDNSNEFIINEECWIDLQPYKCNQAFRILESVKFGGGQIIKDSELEIHDQYHQDKGDFFLQCPYDYKCELEIPPCWETSKNKKTHHKNIIRSDIPLPSIIDESIVRKVKYLIKDIHPEFNGGIETDINVTTFVFKWYHPKGKCLIHERNHPNLTHNTFYITYCRITSKYFFNCFNSDQSKSILLTPNKGFIPEWNYEYEGRTEIVCDPLLPLSQLGEGGTFMLQSPKGNGKTESIRTFLNSDELKNKST